MDNLTLKRESIKRILIVDDSSTSRMILKRCFQIAGFIEVDFLEADNGLDALDIVEGQKVDLIVTDINMPKLNGRNLIKKLEEDEKLGDIGVIVISSRSQSADIDMLTELGVNYVLTKPLKPEKLIEIFGEVDGEF